MPSSPNEDFPEAVALFLAGMAVPVAVAAPAHDLLALYLSGTAYTVLAAAAFAVLAWTVLETFDLDRPNFAVASVVGPFLCFVTIVAYGIATSGYADLFEYLFHDNGYITYPAAFGAAGLLAVVVSRQYRNVATGHDRLPPARTVAAALGVLAVALLVVVLGANLAAVGVGRHDDELDAGVVEFVDERFGQVAVPEDDDVVL
jgi:hypothetical protein